MPEHLFKVNIQEYMLPGQRACQGCGLSLAYRYILKALRENTILTFPACCLTVLHGLYPTTSVTVPALNCTFASTAASASGIVAGLNALNRTDITVVAIAGDGGTFDMGIQALSGALERGTDFIYVCYDNEGYMNTGTSVPAPTLGRTDHPTPCDKTSPEGHVANYEATSAYLASMSPAYPLTCMTIR